MHLRLLTLFLLFVGVFSTAAQAEPMSFSIHPVLIDCPSCVIVEANGEITEETPALFRRFTTEHQLSFPKSMTFVMNSPGGSLMGGLALGQLIRNGGFNTHVGQVVAGADGKVALADGICASACAYAFLGGSKRSIGLRGKYGLHQISTSSREAVTLRDAVGTTQDVIARISRYVEKMGASAEVVTIATQTRSTDISWVDGPKQSSLRIVNSPGLNAQEPWKSNGSFANWSVWSTASDGSRVLFLLSCSEYSDKGSAGLSVSHYRPLPENHLYYNRHEKLPVHVLLNGVSVASFEETVWFDRSKTDVSNLKVPAATLHRAAQSREKLSVSIDYPAEIGPAAEVQGFTLPVAGFATAVSAMTKQCPHLTNVQENWKKSDGYYDEWTYSQATGSGDINLFKVNCSIFRKGVVFLGVSHNYGDLAAKTRRAQGVDSKGETQVFVSSGGAALYRAKDGSFMDTPWFTSVLGLEASAVHLFRSLQRPQPISVGWGSEPALLNAFGAASIAFPTNGLAEALAALREKCPNLYK